METDSHGLIMTPKERRKEGRKEEAKGRRLYIGHKNPFRITILEHIIDKIILENVCVYSWSILQ